MLRRALPRLPHIRTSISVTTRGPRPQERHGVDYFYVSRETFAEMLDRQEFLESAEVHGNCYGTPRPWVEEQLQTGTDVILEIDVQGALHVHALCPDAVLIFVAPPSLQELERRLRRRDTESETTIRTRLDNARGELEQATAYDYLIINDDLEQAVREFTAIVTAERCRPQHRDFAVLLEEGPAHG